MGEAKRRGSLQERIEQAEKTRRLIKEKADAERLKMAQERQAKIDAMSSEDRDAFLKREHDEDYLRRKRRSLLTSVLALAAASKI